MTRAPLTVVSGAPGAGKTVALQQWRASGISTGARVAWLSLDPADDAPGRFWSYVLLALERSGAGSFPETRAVVAEPRPDGDAVVITLLNELSDQDPVFLVLDDLHQVTDQTLLDQLELFVDRVPEGFRLVASARLDPPLPLARWRGAGRVREVRQDVLAFTPAEARALFGNLASACEVADVDLVTRRTEGWPVALQLAALSTRDRPVRPTVDELVDDGSPVAAYLTSEVVDRQAPEVREFLVDTSVLDVFDADLCDVVTGRSDARAMLRMLRANNLFVVPLHGHQYRYHQLFREFARLLLRAEDADGTRERTLHRRAAEHLAAEGEVARAVPHFLEAEEIDAAFELAVAPGMDLWDRDGDRAEAARMLELFPIEYLEHEPHRVVAYTVALGSSGQWKQIPPLLEVAERHADRVDDPELRADLDAVRIAVHVADGDARRALAHRQSPPALACVGGGDRRLRVRAGPNLARAFLLVDDHDAAVRALAATPANDPTTDHLVVPSVQARLAAWRGELDRALSLVDGVIAASRAFSAHHHFAVLDASLAAASVHVDRADLNLADEVLERALGLAEERKAIGYQVMAMLLQARVAILRDDPEDALSTLAIGRRSLRATGVSGGLVEHVDATASCAQLRLGERDLAGALARGVGGERGALLRAHLAAAAHDDSGVVDLLANREWSNLGHRLEALLLLAGTQRDAAAARALVAEAVECAADDGFVRPFLESGPHVRELALHASERSSGPDAWDLGIAIRAGASQVQSPVLLEPLSAREREVLRCLRRPWTYEEVGRELYVSTNTVRTHVRAIFRKLGVRSRAEALARARALHLS